MKLFRSLNSLTPQHTPPAPAVNKFRDVAITIEGDSLTSMPIIRRLLDLQLSRSLAFPQPTTSALITPPYDVMVINLLLQPEGGIVVMQYNQYLLVKKYLETQLYMIVRDKASPFYDITAETLFAAIKALLYVVDNYTSIKTL